MPDPLTAEVATTIATAIASQAAQALTSQAGHALTEMRQWILRKFHGRPVDLAALANAQDDPGSPARISALATALCQAARQDPAFGPELLALWAHARNQITNVSDNATANVFYGHAEKVVQVHDIHGDLTIN